MRPADYTIVLSFTMGLRTLDIPNERAWAFASGTYYEYNVDAWLFALAARIGTPIVYDIGANIGYYSMRTSQVARHVYAFEPVSSTFDVLRGSIAKSPGAPVTALRLGVSDGAGMQAIQLLSSSGGNSLFHQELPGAHPHHELGEEVIDLATIDGLVTDGTLDPPDLMKIDIEGGELGALRGARDVLAASMPALVMEFEESICRRAGYRTGDLIAELRGIGYEIWGLGAPNDLTLHPLSSFGERPIANLVAVRPGMELPDDAEVRRAYDERPRLGAVQRFQALYAMRYRTGRGSAPASPAHPAAAEILVELAERRGHIDLVVAERASDSVIAAVRPHVRGVVGIEPDASLQARTAKRFAADAGVDVRSGAASVVAELVADAPRPPLVWLGKDADAALGALAACRVPVGTTIAAAAAGDTAGLVGSAEKAFPSAAVSTNSDVVLLEL